MKNKKMNLNEKLFHVGAMLRWEQRKNFGSRTTTWENEEHRILALLKLKPEINQNELCGFFDMSSECLTALLERLEDVGYITLTGSSMDNDSQKVTEIKLTEQGAKAAAENAGPGNENKVFDCLSAEERDSLHDMLDRLSDSLKVELGDDAIEKMRNFAGHDGRRNAPFHSRHEGHGRNIPFGRSFGYGR